MKTILTAVAAAAIAVCAQAQTRKVAPAEQDYTINDIVSASGQNVTYQWFRDGAAIAGATGASYTVPASLAKMENGLGDNYTLGSVFQRAAYGIDCAGGMAMSNEIVVYFCELMVNGVCWARANSDVYGKITSNPYVFGGIYQWNVPAAYSSTSPAAGAAVSGWNSTPDYTTPTWTSGVPCPSGWRLPTPQDFRNLHAMSQPVGGVWVQGGARGVPAGTNGRLYGYNTTYCTMSSMSGCVFLPAAGVRDPSNGALTNQGISGYYWSDRRNTSSTVFAFTCDGSSSVLGASRSSNGFSIRCVQDVQ